MLIIFCDRTRRKGSCEFALINIKFTVALPSNHFFSFCIQLLLVIGEGAQENSCSEDTSSPEADESKLPLQLAIVGRPNVGKSTLLNALLQEDRVLVGPEAGLTRDSIRTQFEFQGRTIYLVCMIN